MSLPTELLQAVCAVGGGKITLIVGAGCSLEYPTSIPLAKRCSTESHDRLIADGILNAGDCTMPENLSCLADAVVTKTGSQRALVEQLSQHYGFKTATPNEGHLLAAALLREGAITSVLTLNFDLAISIAIADLGVGDTIGIIEGPHDFPRQKTINLYYLHRNANANDPETWILRTNALEKEWQGNWEAVVAAKVLSTPIVIFVGLGSPADVLVKSTKLIQEAIPNGSKIYLVDPGDSGDSAFFTALGLDLSAFIQLKWCDFMEALSERLVIEHTSQLLAAANTKIQRDQVPAEDITVFLNRLKEIGLLKLGRLRANWLLHDKPYCNDDPLVREHVADLLLAAAMVTRVAGVTAILSEDGIVEFRRGDRTVASYMFVSGRGSRSRIAIESELPTRQRRHRGRTTPPTGAIVAGTTSNIAAQPITTPPNVILGDTSQSIVIGQTALSTYYVETLRHDPRECKKVAP